MRLISKKIDMDYCLVALLGVVAFVCFTFVCHKNYCNSLYNSSDFLATVMIGKDIFNGNILLKGWYGSTNSWYLLGLLYGLIGFFIGYKYYLLSVVGGFLFAIMIVFVSCEVLHLNKDSGIERYIKLFFSLALISISSYCKPPLGAEMNCSGVHFDAAIVSILYMYVTGRILDDQKISKPTFAFVTILYVLGVVSDAYVMIFTIVPMFFVVFYHLFFTRPSNQKKVKLLGVFLISCILVLFSKLLLKVCLGMVVPLSLRNYPIIEHKEMFSQLAFFTKTLFYVFGIDFFGKNVSMHNLPIFIFTGVFAAIAFSFFSQIKSILKRGFFLQLCFASVVVSFLLIYFMQSEKNMGYGFAARLLFVCLFCSMILFSAIDYEKILEKISINKIVFYGAIIFVSTLMLVVSAKNIPFSKHYNKENRTYTKIALALKKEGATNGFATYWNAFPIEEASNYELSVKAIDKPFPVFFKWLSKMPDDNEKSAYANFVVFDDSKTGGITDETICMSLGKPKKIININDKHIYLYDRNIAPDIYFPMQSKWIENGQDRNGIRYLLPGGVSWGPYWNVKKGSYHLKIDGQRLDKVKFILHSQMGRMRHAFEMSAMQGCIDISFDLAADVSDLEFYIKNESGKILSINRIVLTNADTDEERIWSFEAE